MAESFEEVYRRRQTEAQVRRVMSDIFEEIHAEPLSTTVTLSAWFDKWLKRIKPEVKPASYRRYLEVTIVVKKLAPKMCEKLIDRVESKDVLALRETLAATRAPGTTNVTLKILRQCFKAAWVEGIISDNPAAKVSSVRADNAGEVRRPFTLEEIRQLVAAADDEWRGMILAGVYTAGQRLSDICTMTPANVDIAQRFVRFSTGKTGRDVIVPIVEPWMNDLKARVKGRGAAEPLFPKANARFLANGRDVGRVSNSFRRVLARIGLATAPHKARKGAVTGRRQVSALSFHSFRHTATSMLKNAGVSDSVVMDIVGHESEAVSRNYTHIDDTTKRTALEKLPSIG